MWACPRCSIAVEDVGARLVPLVGALMPLPITKPRGGGVRPTAVQTGARRASPVPSHPLDIPVPLPKLTEGTAGARSTAVLSGARHVARVPRIGGDCLHAEYS